MSIFSILSLKYQTGTAPTSIQDYQIMHRYKLLNNNILRKINDNYWLTHIDVQ